MARKKKDVLKEIETAMCEAQYRLVRTTTGQLRFTRPTPSGTSVSAVEFDQDNAAAHVARLLFEKELDGNFADIRSVLTVLRSKAFDADPIRVYNRVAEAPDGTIYLDLCDAAKQVIEIRPDGWRECKTCPVLFNRPASMLPLPSPVGGQSVELLREVLGLQDENLWLLVLGFLLSCLKERATHFVAVVQGPVGAGKSLLTRYLSRLLDHRDPQTPRIPPTRKDIMAVGAHRYILTIDNMTPPTPQQSGDLCAILTGSGLEGKQNYTDFGSCGADVRRPMVVNGIEQLLTRAEIQSRAIPITLPERPPHTRRTDEEIEDDFNRHWAAILGGILDLTVKGLGLKVPVLDRARSLRMLSSIEWVERCFQANGMGCGRFLSALVEAQTSVTDAKCDDWSLLPYLEAFAGQQVEGTANDLFLMLRDLVQGGIVPPDFPRSAQQFGTQIREHARELRRADIDVRTRHTNKGTHYSFGPVAPAPVGAAAQPQPSALMSENAQPAQRNTISEDEFSQLVAQFGAQSKTAHQSRPQALVYIDLPDREPILCGESAEQAAQALGVNHHNRLLPVARDDLEQYRIRLGKAELFPLRP
jgi:hypothetical protein